MSTGCGCEATGEETDDDEDEDEWTQQHLMSLRRSSTTAYSPSWRYIIDPEPLGEGAFGTVHLATDRTTGERFALKRIAKEYTETNDSFLREMDALLRVRESGGHPHICSLRENFDEGDNYVLILDLIEGGEMFDHLIANGAYSELDASRLMREVASALAFMHGVGVVHVDLKPENLMLSSKRATECVIKVVDFGSAEVSKAREEDEADATTSCTNNNENERCTFLGRTTTAYCPPEVIDALYEDKKDAEVDPAVDMWALGIILYIMLVGIHPFDPTHEATDEEIEERIMTHRVPSLDNEKEPHLWHLSPAAIDLLSKLLTEDPAKRITAQEMLSHPWVKGTNARRVKMREVSERLAAFKGLKPEIERTVFERLVDWSGKAEKESAKGQGGRKKSGSVGGGSKPLMEMAFQSFDKDGDGVITVDDVAGKKAAAASSNEDAAKADDGCVTEDPALTLSDFSDLVSDSMKSRYFPAGHVVYEEGDRGDHLYFIDSGTVEILTRDGFRTTLGHGSTFGEGAMFDPDARRSATVRCKTPLHAIEVSRECFRRYLADKDDRSQDMHLDLRERNRARKLGRAGAVLSQRKDLRRIELKAGQKAFDSNEAESVYVVDRGVVDTFNDGNVVFTANPGDIFGLSSIYKDRICKEEAKCRSHTGCTVRSISAEDFKRMIAEAPVMRDAIQELFLRREIQRAVVHKLKKSFSRTEENLREAFDAIDTDGSGTLDRDELRELLLLLDDSMSEEKIETAIRTLDLDDNGCIDFKEFKRIFARDDE